MLVQTGVWRSDLLNGLTQQQSALRTPSANEGVVNAIAVEVADGNVPAATDDRYGYHLLGDIREIPVAIVAVCAHTIRSETGNGNSA